jgi:hypothetical protein
MSRLLYTSALAMALAAAAPTQAQPKPATPDPLDPKAAVPPAQHRSAMGTYRPSADTPVGSWKEANERVNRIGGWRAYAREAAQPASAPVSAPAPAAHRH